jgi:hypothetical protein
VQCSNCGDTWFQHHPDHTPDIDDTEDEESGWDAPPDPEAPYEKPSPQPAEDETSQEQDEIPDTPPRRELDPSVAGVLREEAERERAARAAESGAGLETQQELGLDEASSDSAKRQAEAQARMARLRGEEEEQAEPLPPDPGTRRNLLPDIDEINSSLSSDSTDPGTVQPGDSDDMDVAPRKSGFRRGFNLVLLLAVIGLLLYVFAPQLAEALPALQPALASYVEMVNGLRLWLAQTVGGLLGEGAPPAS